MNLLMKGAALAPPFSCTTKYSSDVYSPRPPDIRVRLLPTKPPVHFTTEQPGRDNIVLYSGNQLVVFFSSNTWNYTKLGHINLAAEKLAGLLGGDSAVIEVKYE